MNTTPISTPFSLRAAAAAFALGVTAFGLVGVDGLAKHRTVSPYAQVVELQRVVVTGHRLTATAPTPVVVAQAQCKASTGSANQGAC
jgi:hypothetical protein